VQQAPRHGETSTFPRIWPFIGLHPNALAQHSVARQWNEALLQNIREDLARPPVQARNLFHASIALYDAWAVYDTVARPYLLGNTVGNYTCPFVGVPPACRRGGRSPRQP
jgi:hypothetical protein